VKEICGYWRFMGENVIINKNLFAAAIKKKTERAEARSAQGTIN
jgi:hypothetical protein